MSVGRDSRVTRLFYVCTYALVAVSYYDLVTLYR